jgi:hypothetical protein
VIIDYACVVEVMVLWNVFQCSTQQTRNCVSQSLPEVAMLPPGVCFGNLEGSMRV